MKEGINQMNSLFIDFMSKSKSGKDSRKRTLYSEHSGSDSEAEPSEPENIPVKFPQTRTAPKRARYSTQEGHSQTTKIVQAPSEVIETPLVEPSGPDKVKVLMMT